jgi:hypothetical protein
MSAPRWCQRCAAYRCRDHECERPVPIRPAAEQVPVVRNNVVPAPPAASSPAYVVGWRDGYQAALRDVAERRAA